ncbi:LppA family lipoprotein [Spongisporangium articulatum]|uniref:LppA family lipoprotein n=1 Tax=Spongisporangium articulatum TaxID=3362603 RepID=A0ABW8ATX6_9ACTN
MDSVEAEQELRSRPSFESAQADYLAMLDAMREAFSQVTPSLRWKTTMSAVFNQGLCAPPFTKVEGAGSATYDSGDAVGVIAVGDWPRTEQAVAAVGARYGFTGSQAMQKGPTNFYVVLHGRYGDTVEFGFLDGSRVVLSVYGACFIRQVEPTPYVPPDPFAQSPTPSSSSSSSSSSSVGE